MIELEPAASAYDYPLLIKHLLYTPLAQTPDQEIVYRDRLRFSYTTLRHRIEHLAAALKARGIRPGDTVAIMDWDSHRYLECFFAVPMMGAVLHTINVRLSPGQILYTINHAEDDLILAHRDFMPVIDEIRSGKLSLLPRNSTEVSICCGDISSPKIISESSSSIHNSK